MHPIYLLNYLAHVPHQQLVQNHVQYFVHHLVHHLVQYPLQNFLQHSLQLLLQLLLQHLPQVIVHLVVESIVNYLLFDLNLKRYIFHLNWLAILILELDFHLDYLKIHQFILVVFEKFFARFFHLYMKL